MEIDEALSVVNDGLHAARDRLRDTISRYNTEGAELLAAAATEIERIKDDYSATARADADVVLGHLRDARGMALGVSTAVGAMLVAFDWAITRATMTMISFPKVDRAFQPGHLSEAWNDAKSKREATISDAAIIAIGLGVEVADLLNAAADLMDARLDVTEGFLMATSDELRPPRTDGAKTVIKTVVINGAEMGLDEIVKQALPRALERVPILGIGVTFVDIVRNVRKEAADAKARQSELREAYHKRNARDDMDDYDAGLLRQSDGLAKLTTTLDQLATGLTELDVSPPEQAADAGTAR